ncbi:hypothetical protein A3C96_00855 [Candidatus Uhrbacteria bacterium RIFCSPHIGHO2_02_FULL_60_10]|uniref:Dephospho-CoA kinase n=1 Tax=Candidatus Uhrbacteria bacterium RIFCSPHIGHO2_02_FULL_60_10 TaxID=1802392 RepID=A0A1F7U6F0_9BACT|nr:MAG: hypothetical protein A3C96_00855 [Candidatus Uhrbacteria bacterium RIFCSPHIGHO2_02_FULL_60_10]
MSDDHQKSTLNDFDCVIGLVGLKAAGKDEFADYVTAKYGFTVRRCGDEIRAQLRSEGHEKPTIAQQIELGNRARLESGDIGYWAKRVLERARQTGNRLMAVNGIRHPAEVDGLRTIAGDAFTLVGIVAPFQMRAKRLLERGRDGDPKTMEEFTALDQKDRGIGQPAHGQQVGLALKMVGVQNMCQNDGTMEKYHAWIDALMARVLAKK